MFIENEELMALAFLSYNTIIAHNRFYVFGVLMCISSKCFIVNQRVLL